MTEKLFVLVDEFSHQTVITLHKTLAGLKTAAVEAVGVLNSEFAADTLEVIADLSEEDIKNGCQTEYEPDCFLNFRLLQVGN